MGRKKKKWFKPGWSLGWEQDLNQSIRIERALKSRRGNVLRTARALLALADVIRDPETKHKARTDANKLFRLYERGEKKRFRV